MDDTKTLKPCPFCGGEAKITEESDCFSSIFFVARCQKCLVDVRIGAEMTKSIAFNREKVTEAWNKRPNPWHTGEPTESEEDERFEYNYALVLNTPYDCIGNYLAGHLFKPDLGQKVFYTQLDYERGLTIPFKDVVAWQRIEPFRETT